MKRFLDCNASDFSVMDGPALKEAIAASEGRVLVCETIGVIRPLLGDVSNAEFAAAMGADIILLNVFDVNQPKMEGLPPCAPEGTIRLLKKLTGRPVGINLEPVETMIEGSEEVWSMSAGRTATAPNARKAADMGADFIVLTGNPGMGVSNGTITASLAAIRQEIGTSLLLIAGKMHAAGVLGEAAENIITKNDIKAFVAAGADVILMPAPGTVPGITLEYVRELVTFSHGLGALTLTTVGTSQEGADEATIRQIALMCKMAGTDLHHLGDTGYFGMAVPENIQAYSKAIRGIRHTYRRMAASINR